MVIFTFCFHYDFGINTSKLFKILSLKTNLKRKNLVTLSLLLLSLLLLLLLSLCCNYRPAYSVYWVACVPEAKMNFFDTAAAHQAHSLRSEEHTSELQSRQYLVCRLLLEKKKYIYINIL